MSEEMVSARALTAEELAAWRAGGTVASPAGTYGTPADVTEVEKQTVRPLAPSDAFDQMLAGIYRAQRESRDAYQAAARWYRATAPNAVAHLTDEQLRDYLAERCKEAVERIARKKGLWKPVRL